MTKYGTVMLLLKKGASVMAEIKSSPVRSINPDKLIEAFGRKIKKTKNPKKP